MADERPDGPANAPDAGSGAETGDGAASRLTTLLPWVSAALFAVGVVVVRRELQPGAWKELEHHVAGLGPDRWLLAAIAVAVSFATLVGYDWLAVRTVGLDLRRRRVAFAALIGWAFSNALGHAWLSGGSVRLRLYGGWGVAAADTARVVALTTWTFWLGFLVLVGGGLVAQPVPSLGGWRWALAGLAWAVPVAVFAAGAFGRTITIRGWTVRAPPPRLFAAQLLLGAVDQIAAIAALYAVFPGAPPFGSLVVAFAAANALGVLSGIPGGAGAFEAAFLALLPPGTAAGPVFGALLAWRVVYYLVPLAAAAGTLAGYEVLGERRAWVAGATARVIGAVLPMVLSASAFAAGVVLVVSAATPADRLRMAVLSKYAPTALIEGSHLASALAGVALLFVARGLWLRLREAWALALALLAVGALTSLAKGIDLEEAAFQVAVLLAAIPARRRFYRKAQLTGRAFTPGWTAAVAATLFGAAALASYAFPHLPIVGSGGSWTVLVGRWGLHEDAARVLRGLTAGAGLVGVVGLASLLRPARIRLALPTEQDLADARRITAAGTSTHGCLAQLADKALVFDEARTAFAMVGVANRAWVVFGDPVGPVDAWPDLLWTLREQADRATARLALYEVGAEAMAIGLDLGLQPYKFGEEGHVPLTGFTLEGGANKGRRATLNKLEKDGVRFEVIPADDVAAHLTELRAVSDDWLGGKAGREKGFSLGFFHEGYLQTGPVAVLRTDARILAFANVLTAGPELSVDLMRFRSDAPNGAMDGLFLSLMRWGAANGFERFTLGMSPLGGMPDHDLAPLWAKVASLVFRHGEPLYNFQGLRQFKEKYRPEWSARWLMCAGPVALPAVLAALVTLVSGGLSGLLRR